MMKPLTHLLRRSLMQSAVGVLLFASSGCEQQMANQPRYDPLEPSRFFEDGMSARPIMDETVARGEMPDDSLYSSGAIRGSDHLASRPSLEQTSDYVSHFPLEVSNELIAHGRERFAIYCAPCHGANGTGSGLVVERGYPQAQSFHSERLREAPVGYLYDVVSRGYQNMPAFAGRIPPRDRWAIIAYVRVMQSKGDVPTRGEVANAAPKLPVDRAEDEPDPQKLGIPTDAGSGRFVFAEGQEANTDREVP